MRLDISGTEHWPKDNYYGLGKETEGPSECVRRVGWSLMGVLWVSESRPGVAAPPGSWGSGLHSPGSWLRFDWKERSVRSVRLAGGSAGPEAPTLLPPGPCEGGTDTCCWL